MWCKTFAITLKRVARTWFSQIPKSMMASFKQLAESFTVHFIASKPVKKSASYLYTMKQGATKSLQEYVAWFNKVCLEIPS